jgi:DNA-binding transcriptional LysR family regulator
MDLDLLRFFVTVAETASFSVAARKLGVTKSSVSRGVAALEAALGAQLLHRTTRTVALSTAGSELYQRTAPALAAIRAALGSLPERDEHPSGILRITAPNDLGATLLSEVTVRFLARYPQVKVDVRLTNRKVDLVAEGFDLAVRAATGKLADSSLLRGRRQLPPPPPPSPPGPPQGDRVPRLPPRLPGFAPDLTEPLSGPRALTCPRT